MIMRVKSPLTQLGTAEYLSKVEKQFQQPIPKNTYPKSCKHCNFVFKMLGCRYKNYKSKVGGIVDDANKSAKRI